MARIDVYLTFNGNCREAMTFYQACLGGELSLQTLGESPMAEYIPIKMRKSVLHATLICKDLVMMASDMVPEEGLIKGNSVSLCLTCQSEEEIRTFYEKLSEDGESTYPLHATVGEALFGNLIDKYGNYWLLNYPQSEI